MKKVLLIDVGYLEYFQEFSNECKKQISTTVISKYYTGNPDVIPFFYKYSEKMKQSIFRKIVRLIEYIYGYHKTLKHVKKNNYDVIHIHWAVVPVIDLFYFKKLKKYTGKLIYTAHDVIPHSEDPRLINQLKKVYRIPDRIVVHGEYCANELKKYYLNSFDKCYKQKFGFLNVEYGKFNSDLFNKHKKLSLLKNVSSIKVFSFIGQISYYKGLDLLINSWKESFINNDKVFLIIAGRIIQDYPGIKDKLLSIAELKNVYVYNDRFTDEEEVLFYSLSDVVVLPYRTASMSGVLYSAAKYKKTVLSTTAGCLKEYLLPIHDVFICDESGNDLSEQLNNIITNYSKKELEKLGKRFGNYIRDNYSWDAIIKKLLEECYEIE